MKIYHVATTYKSANQNERERNARAQATWAALYQAHSGIFVPAHSSSYKRSSADLGERKVIPYVRDVILEGVSRSQNSDLIVLTNTDTSFCTEAIRIVAAFLYHNPCCWSSRRETEKPHRTVLSQEQMMLRTEGSIGVDLFAFTMDWWRGVGVGLPDLLMGFEGWDWVYKFAMGSERELVPPVIYHEFHQEPYWSQNRGISPANLYNRDLCLKWVSGLDAERQAEVRASWKSLALYANDSRGIIK